MFYSYRCIENLKKKPKNSTHTNEQLNGFFLFLYILISCHTYMAMVLYKSALPRACKGTQTCILLSTPCYKLIELNS